MFHLTCFMPILYSLTEFLPITVPEGVLTHAEGTLTINVIDGIDDLEFDAIYGLEDPGNRLTKTTPYPKNGSREESGISDYLQFLAKSIAVEAASVTVKIDRIAHMALSIPISITFNRTREQVPDHTLTKTGTLNRYAEFCS